MTDTAPTPSTPFAAVATSPFASAKPAATPPRPTPTAPAPSLTPAKAAGLRGLVAICAAGMHRAPSEGGVGPAARPAGRVEIVGTAHVTDSVRRLAKSVVRGLRAQQPPVTAPGGLGGTYFFLDEGGRHAAIVKPCDEEPLAPNNPNGYVGRALGDPGLKPSVRVGEAAMREVAAYLLDRGFARVPPTVLVRVAHPVFHWAREAGADAAPPQRPSRYAPSLPTLPATPRGSNDDLAACGGASTPPTDSAESTARAPGAKSPAPLRPGSLSAALRGARSGDLGGSAGSGGTANPPAFKLASMQRYVPHLRDASDVGPSSFPTADVHRIGLLDARLFNSDRHAGNVLVCRRRRRSSSSGGAPRPPRAPAAAARAALGGDPDTALVPIDHGFCLPEALEPVFFEWLFWPQAMQPFGVEEREAVAALDIEADLDLLRRELPSLHVGCLRVLRIGTLVVQKAVAAGLTLYEIGAALSRPLVGMDEEPSAVERRIAWAARAAALAADAECDCGDDDGPPLSPTMTRAATCPAPGSAPTSPLGFAAAELTRRTDADALFHGADSGAGSDSGAMLLSPTFTASPSPPPWMGMATPTASIATSVGSCDAASTARAPTRPPHHRPTRAASAALPPRGTHDGGVGGPSAPTPASPRLPTGPRALARAASRRAPCGGRAAAYPPPVVAAAPGAVVPLADLSASAWTVFLDAFAEGVDDALASGAWRAGGAGHDLLGASAPT